METHHITPARGLSETGLKWIALVTMVLDHIHYFFSFTGCVPEWFSMVGRLGAPLFLFCLVEGFTHTHSRKRYFARVYVLSTAMSLLFFFMAFAHVLVRPDGFYPANGMMTTFVILMVMFQGIDWLGRRHIVRGLAALLLPLAWPFLASALCLAVPALATSVGLDLGEGMITSFAATSLTVSFLVYEAFIKKPYIFVPVLIAVMAAVWVFMNRYNKKKTMLAGGNDVAGN